MRRMWWMLLVVVGYLISCSHDDGFRDPLTDEEIQQMGVSQGIAGRAAARGGNCSATLGPQTCRVGPLRMELRVLAAEPALVTRSDSPTFCFARYGLDGVSLAALAVLEESPSIAASASLEGGVYAASLEPGTYQVVLVDDSGCATCADRWYRVETGFQCATATVEAGKVTRLDFLLDTAAH